MRKEIPRMRKKWENSRGDNDFRKNDYFTII